MKLKPIRDFLLAMPGSVESTPFGPDVLVFKAGNKMFALLVWQEQPLRMNLKCDPERAIDLRERHAAIDPGFHMNKQHWNTVTLDSSLETEFVFDQVRHSHELIVAGLTKKARLESGL